MDDKIREEKFEMLDEGLEYMCRVLSQIDKTCANLRKKEGIDAIAQISEGFMATMQIVKYTADLTQIKIDDENIKGFVAEMVEGMENGDFNLVADIIEYEFKPLYDEWAEAFDRVVNND